MKDNENGSRYGQPICPGAGNAPGTSDSEEFDLGANYWTRTNDLHITSVPLYHLS